MIKPALKLVEDFQALYFIPDYHALTTIKNRETLIQLSYEVAATWLALGLDPEGAVLYRQSDIPEIFELAWILACFTSKGLLNRAHAYKTATEENVKAGRSPDSDIHADLFNYPVLMAADILIFGAHLVPVGFDQKQHVEIARDIAISFNNNYGDILTLPQPLIDKEVMTIPGLDGRKMSKSYNNTIPIFLPPEELRKRVMQIVTDSRRPEESKDPDKCNVFAIYRHFASSDMIEATRQRYLQGGLAYSEIKEELFELLDHTFRDVRQRYNALLRDQNHIDHILLQGAEKARAIAIPMIQKIRKVVGVAR